MRGQLRSPDAWLRAALVALGPIVLYASAPALPSLTFGVRAALADTPPAAPAGEAHKEAAPAKQTKVAVHIVVIEADKKSKEMDKRAEPFRKKMPGYEGAKVLDELTAPVEEGSSVSLEIMKKSKEPRLLKVTVQKVEPDKSTSLHVSIDALKFDADTRHKNNGTLLVAKPLSDSKALFLAITPKVP